LEGEKARSGALEQGRVMNMFSFRGMLVVACVSAAALHFKPWERAVPTAAGVVAGKAVDGEGRPVVGASVVLRDAKGVVVGRSETESNGAFEFARCKPGRYRVAAAKLGVGGGERGVVVDPRMQADATIPLTDGMTAVGHR
jgi:hypothetical protein